MEEESRGVALGTVANKNAGRKRHWQIIVASIGGIVLDKRFQLIVRSRR